MTTNTNTETDIDVSIPTNDPRDKLPTGFYDWPRDAQHQFLMAARQKRELINMLLAANGVEYRIPSGEMPTRSNLSSAYLAGDDACGDANE